MSARAGRRAKARPRPAGGKRAAGGPAPASAGGGRLATAAEAIVWLLVLAVPVVLVPTARDAFRLPKLVAGEWLALASLIPLALAVARVERVGLGDVWRLPAFRAVAPLVAVATVGLAFTAHRAQSASGLADLWIGAAALVGWSAGLGTRRLERLLAATLLPASLLATLAVLQFHGLYRPIDLVGGQEATRMGITSLAGNPGDLAGLLALAVLLAQALAARAFEGRGGGARLRAASLAALAVCLYALVLTQTVTAVAAAAAGSAVFWWLRLAGRRRLFAAGLAAAAVAAAVALTVGPLAARSADMLDALRAGRVDVLLTGRLDGWRAAAWMAREHPWAGVGHSAYVAEYGTARLALEDRGVEFYRGHALPYFGNAHNEILEAAAELGLPGLAALAWGLAVVAACAWRRGGGAGAAGEGRRSRAPATAWGGLTVLAVLSLGQFPFHLALTAFPALLLLAWVCRWPPGAGGADAGGAEAGAAAGEGGRGPRGRHLAWALAALLAAGLALHTDRSLDLLRASRIRQAVEGMTGFALQSGRAAPTLLWGHVQLLDRAAELDPASAAVRQALGVQYLLLGRLGEAETELRRALALEPRPETWLNLGRVLWAGGRRREAEEAFHKAVRLDPRLRRELPPGAAGEGPAAPPAPAPEAGEAGG